MASQAVYHLTMLSMMKISEPTGKKAYVIYRNSKRALSERKLEKTRSVIKSQRSK